MAEEECSNDKTPNFWYNPKLETRGIEKKSYIMTIIKRLLKKRGGN